MDSLNYLTTAKLAEAAAFVQAYGDMALVTGAVVYAIAVFGGLAYGDTVRAKHREAPAGR